MIFRHQPKGLPFLFFTEMWERFGFYIVQGLLVLYMTQYFGFSDSYSYTILGLFTGLVYISPLAGGFIASHFLGLKRSVICGGIILILGYALLALPFTSLLLYPALSIIIIGNGLFKPNVSSLVGAQYAPHDKHRHPGFTIFYVGIYLGVFLAGISSGYIKDLLGWRVSFAFASIGLIIGLFIFCYGLKSIQDTHIKLPLSLKLKSQLSLYGLLTIVLVDVLLNMHWLANVLLPCAGIALLAYLAITTRRQDDAHRKNMFVLAILIISSTIFWMLFFQIFNSANLFIDRLVDKSLFGIHLTTTVFYAVQSIFVILLGPAFAWLWHVLNERNFNPSPMSKFAVAIFCAGLAFLILSTSTLFLDNADLINPFWVFFAYLLITIGELLLSPIGLSAVTTLAPPHLTHIMMGAWFVATGFGGMLAGWIAKLSNVPENVHSTNQKLVIYQDAFFAYACMAFVTVVILLLTRYAIKHLERVKN